MDKFAFLKKLQRDTGLTDAAFRIGVAVCTSYTRRDGTGWVFDLDDLPAAAGSPYTRNTVKGALALLLERKHLTETYRSKGGRGIRACASYDLNPHAQTDGFSDETRSHRGQNPHVQTGGLGGETRTSGRENPHVQTEKPARPDVKTRTSRRTKNCSDQDRNPPPGTSSGDTSGTTSGGEVSPEPGKSLQPEADSEHSPPPLFCRLHPNGTADRCPGCGDARRRRDEWIRTHPDWALAEETKAQLIKNLAKDRAREMQWDVLRSNLQAQEPEPQHVPSERIEDDEPAKCGVCGSELDPDGSCSTYRRCQPVVDGPGCSTEGCTGRAEKDGLCGRCLLRSGSWRRSS